MSYATYTTEAIVCGSYDRLTADRTYLLFTETAGMVFATARSAREERSKQRYALQDFAHVRVSLVKGKSGWRIGSVESFSNYYTTAPDRAARGRVVAVVQLLRRLLTGEDPTPQTFRDTVHILQTVAGHWASDAYEVYMLRVLAQLGYIAPHTSYQKWLDRDDWYLEPATLSSEAEAAITQGLTASHL